MHVIASYVKALWQFARPRTLILIWLHIVVAYVFLSSEVPSIESIVLALLVSAFAYINAVAVNDLSDEEVDAINLPHQQQAGDRPIINKTLSRRQAWTIAGLSCLLCIACSAALSLWLGVAAIIMVGLNVVYSVPPIQVSKRGILAQLLLPIMYVVFPFCIAISLVHSVTSALIGLGVGFYMMFIGRLFLKDIRDESGDREVGKLTYLVRHGLKLTLVQSTIWTVSGLIVSCVFVMIRLQEPIITGVIAGIAGGGVVWALWKCSHTPILEERLLIVAIMGRFVSLWVFAIVIFLTLSYTDLAYLSKMILVLLTTGIFLAGVLMLYEELQATRRRRVLKRS